MVTVVKDDDERVISYIEWVQVGQSGFDKLYGEFVYIRDFWIHPDFRGDKSIWLSLASQILRKSKGATHCYFQRRKYGGRVSKMYTREHFEKMVEKGVLCGR